MTIKQDNKKFCNQVEFAKIIDKTKQYVTTLKKESKLVFKGKLIDVDETLKLLEKLSDPAKKKTNFIKDIPKDIKGDLTEEEIENILENEDPNDFNQSKSRKEYYLSKISQLNFLKESDKLIERELVELQYFNVSRLLRDKIFNIKYRIANQLSIMSDPVEISNLLDKEFRLVFSEIVDEVEKQLKELENDYDKDE